MDLKTLVPIGTGIAGVAAGFAIGWFLHKPPTPASIGAEAKVIAPTGTLSKDDAQKLVNANYATSAVNTMQCRWANLQKKSEKEHWAMYDQVKCIHALEEVSLLSVGKCAATGCTDGCCNYVVDAAGAAKFGENDALFFKCGEFKEPTVTSVTTDGNKATIALTREFAIDEKLMSKIADCSIDKPPVGKAERQRHAARDDAGAWTLVD